MKLPPLFFICFAVLFFAGMPRGFSQFEKQVDSLKQELAQYEIRKKQLGSKATIQMDTVKMSLLGAIAAKYFKRSAPESVYYANQQLALAEKLKSYRNIGEAYNVLGCYYGNKSDYPRALLYHSRSLAAHKRIKNKEGEFFSYNNIGILYARQGNYPEALKHLLKGLEFAKRLNNYNGISGGYINIGNIYTNQGKYDQSLGYFANGLAVQLKQKDYFAMAYTYQNMGDVYLLLKKPDKSYVYYLKGLKYAETSENYDAKSNNYEGLGKIYFTKKEYSRALGHFLTSLKIREKTKDPYAIANSYNILSNTYLNLGQNSKALYYATEGLKLTQKYGGEMDMMRDFYETLSNICKEKKNYKDAYENYTLFKKMNDSMFNMEKDKKSTELQLNYEFKRKQDEQQLLQQKKDAAVEITVKKQRNTTHFILLVLALVTVFAAGIYTNLRRNQKQKSIIEEQKAVVESQNEIIRNSLTEKETLLREIHHRVKNNLQIISSLLNIQSENIVDKNVLSSIQEGQSRVQAMSLIHQNLYQSEHISNVDIDNYLNELVVYLSRMFGATKAVKVDIATSGLEFDIDTAIPLGLIVNELVSNAYKYAFREIRTGTISITVRRTGDKQFELSVCNDGDALPENFDSKSSTSLGLKLVSILSRQLRGKFSFRSEKGTTSFVVSFKDSKTGKF